MEIRQTKQGLAVDLILRLPHGLHARPSAKLSKAARNFQAQISFITEKGEADAKSMVDLLSLAPQHNERVTLLANGEDAAEALRTLYTQLVGSQE